jgi:clan AA aspartic protease
MSVIPANWNYKYSRTKGTSLTGGKEMGLVYAEIDLTNEDDLTLNRHGYLPEDKIRRVRCRALVDTGAYDLVLNEEIRNQLGLFVVEKNQVTLADERMVRVDMVGPIHVQFEDRTTTVKAVLMPGTSVVLLGAMPMQALRVYVDPVSERLVSWDNPTSQIRRVSLSV